MDKVQWILHFFKAFNSSAINLKYCAETSYITIYKVQINNHLVKNTLKIFLDRKRQLSWYLFMEILYLIIYYLCTVFFLLFQNSALIDQHGIPCILKLSIFCYFLVGFLNLFSCLMLHVFTLTVWMCLTFLASAFWTCSVLKYLIRVEQALVVIWHNTKRVLQSV